LVKDAGVLLEVGRNCWRMDQADRAAILIDDAAYFAAVKSALGKARSTIHMLNWAFDPETELYPRHDGDSGPKVEIGNFLVDLTRARPDLAVRILCWKSAVLVSATQDFFPHRAKRCFNGTAVQFHLDATVPFGACHHQKVIVVDGQVAFVGSSDFCPDRWDTSKHLDMDTRRRNSSLKRGFYASRHEVMALVDGPAAQSLEALFGRRWQRATGETLAPTGLRGPQVWPDSVQPDLEGVATGLSRTEPAWQGRSAVCEVENLHLRSIASATRCIYLENQYLTSPVIGAALAKRLREPEGPEVVLVSNQLSASWFDQMTMDRRRAVIMTQLLAADLFGRLRAYTPLTASGAPILVHAKLAIIDDTLLQVGSSNLNNRSGGFDTECDLSFEVAPDDAAGRAAVGRCRDQLLAYWLACSVDQVAAALDLAYGVGAGIEDLRSQGYTRLSPLVSPPLDAIGARMASWHLGDPLGVEDSWRPWKRNATIAATLARVVDRP
jgi:phosphatidylserine/phosphatidylglycerophosphate/cardiolipin synthase-like enzyme